MVRAKFMLTEIKQQGYGSTSEGIYKTYNDPGRTLVFTAQYDTSIEEDQRFSRATPTGRFEMRVDNPAALAQFELGQQYYLDMTPAIVATAEEPAATA